MKKYLLLAASGTLFFAASNADQSVVAANEEPVVVAAAVEPEPQPIVAAETEEEYNCPFCGVYVTLGAGGSFLKNKIDGNIGINNAAPNVKTPNKDLNRVIGVLGLGGGKVFKENFYVGGEVLCDFSSSKEKNLGITTADGNPAVADDTVKVKTSAVVPSIGLRLGYFNKNADLLFYAKAAASYTSTTFKSHIGQNDYETKVSKFAPAVGLGIEKAFGKKFSGRLEGEYRFKSSKEAYKSASGVNVRALVAYHVNGL